MRLWRRRPPKRLLALLAFRDEMRFLPDWFESARSLVDGVVALDDGSADGSAEFVARQPEVLELIRLPRREAAEWDDAGNHRRLVEASWRHAPDWVIGLDADERLEAGFRERAEKEIGRGERRGLRAFRIHVREIWDDPLLFRADGIWGTKGSARLFAARRDHEFHAMRLHGHWAPLNSRVNGEFPQADLLLYHLRMLSRGRPGGAPRPLRVARPGPRLPGDRLRLHDGDGGPEARADPRGARVPPAPAALSGPRKETREEGDGPMKTKSVKKRMPRRAAKKVKRPPVAGRASGRHSAGRGPDDLRSEGGRGGPRRTAQAPVLRPH